MNTKIVTLLGVLALVGCSSAGYINYGGHNEDEYHEPSHYSYEYKVNDPHTGDEKSHHESNFGGIVKGVYTLKEADGTIREVHYTADKHNGFQAEVKKIGHPTYHPPTTYHHY